MIWIALCPCLLPLSGGIEGHPLLASLLDSLSRADLDADGLLLEMDRAGLRIIPDDKHGAEVFVEGFSDPQYLFLSGIAERKDNKDLYAVFQCSRIGADLVPFLPDTAEAVLGATASGARIMQDSDTVDFAPGAAAQLRCLVDISLVPGAPAGARLPGWDEVEVALMPRFDRLEWPEPDPGDQEAADGWELYQPSGKAGAERPTLKAHNEDPFEDLRASRIDVHGAAMVVRLELVNHLAATGN